MKRTPRALKAVATVGVAAGIAIATVSGANAESPTLSLNVADGSSNSETPEVNHSDLLSVAVGLAQSLNDVANNGVAPQITRTDYGLNVVLDPHVIPGLAEELAPETPTQLAPKTGHTADGRQVVFPTTGRLTSTFGMRWGSMHNGIDIANPVGTPIVSIMDGEVINSGPAQGFGNWIRIKHANGEVSVYGHMQANSLAVRVGDHVTAGQHIATIGSEGHSTGPHLHFEIHPDGVTPVDPQAWFAQQGIYF
ncbi:MAG: M23 family metallopeptidase [Corynebacterium sp.]|nr:M23 family metallopeptidase [Corynebacterium sp.]